MGDHRGDQAIFRQAGSTSFSAASLRRRRSLAGRPSQPRNPFQFRGGGRGLQIFDHRGSDALGLDQFQCVARLAAFRVVVDGDGHEPLFLAMDERPLLKKGPPPHPLTEVNGFAMSSHRAQVTRRLFAVFLALSLMGGAIIARPARPWRRKPPRPPLALPRMRRRFRPAKPTSSALSRRSRIRRPGKSWWAIFVF